MKQINSLLAMCFCAAFLLAMASCSKTGPTGPAGAAGPAGTAGPTGPSGAAGTKGDPGTANVIYSAWLDAHYQAETNQAGDTIIGYVYDTTGITKLTNAVLTNGEVKIYINLGTAAQPAVVPLPYWDPYTQISINPTFYSQEIYLYADLDVSTYLNSSSVKQQQWRYIIIPGGTAARSAIDWNNYAAVKKYLNLPD